MSELNNAINVPEPGSPRFESDTAKSLGRIRDALGPGARPAFGTIELPGLTASRLLATDADDFVESADLVNWVAGTTNRVTVADDSAGGIVLSGPQDYHVDATPEFAGLTIRGSDEAIIFFVDDDEFYVTLGTAIPIATGMPIGLAYRSRTLYRKD